MAVGRPHAPGARGACGVEGGDVSDEMAQFDTHISG